MTTKKWANNYGAPSLWDVQVSGANVGNGIHSQLRVLKMGKVYLAIDDNGGLGNFGVFNTRTQAAQHTVKHRFGKDS